MSASVGNSFGSLPFPLTPASEYTMCQAYLRIRSVIVGCVVMSPPSLCMAAYGTGFSTVTVPGPVVDWMERMRWSRPDVSGPYLESGELPS